MWKLIYHELSYHKWTLMAVIMAIPIFYYFWVTSENRDERAYPADYQQTLAANHLAMKVAANGQFGRNLFAREWGLEYPQGSGKMLMAGGGLWIVGRVEEELRGAIGAFQTQFVAGPRGIFNPEYKGHVYSPETDQWPCELGAPCDETGSPLRVGDQMLWAIYHDNDPARRTQPANQSKPLGLEIRQSAFAFNRDDDLGHVIFLKFQIANRSQKTISDLRVGVWSDPDIGEGEDDLIGCDVDTGLGFAYNSSTQDRFYRGKIPALGIRWLSNSNTEPGWAAFNGYMANAGPKSLSDTYHFLSGANFDGSPLIDPVSLVPTAMAFSGDPVTQTGWLNNRPGDYRMLVGSAPFELLPQTHIELNVAIIAALGDDHLTAIDRLRTIAASAQSAFDRQFQLAPAPPLPPFPRDRPAQQGWQMFMFIIMTFIGMNIIIAIQSKEHRTQLYARLPLAARSGGISRIALIILPTIVILAGLYQFPRWLGNRPVLDALELTFSCAVIVTIYAVFYIGRDLLNTWFERYKTMLMGTLVGFLLVINIVGIVLFVQSNSGQTPEIIERIADMLRIFNPFRYEYGVISLFVTSLVLAWGSVLTFSRRNSYRPE